MAPEGYDPSTKDYKSPVLLLNYRAIKVRVLVSLRNGRPNHTTSTVCTLGTSAKTTACLSFHDSLLFYSRNFYASSGTVVSPAGVQLLLAKGCGLTSRRAVYTAVGCAVAAPAQPSNGSITRYTSGFHNLITYSESWFSLCSFPVLLLS